MLKINTKKEKKTEEENKKKSSIPRYITFLILSIILGGIFTALTSYAATIAASNISYSNSTSGLISSNAQAAIDEIYGSKNFYYLYPTKNGIIKTTKLSEAKNNKLYLNYDNGTWKLCNSGNTNVAECNTTAVYSTTGCGAYGGGTNGTVKTDDGTELGSFSDFSGCGSLNGFRMTVTAGLNAGDNWECYTAGPSSPFPSAHCCIGSTVFCGYGSLTGITSKGSSGSTANNYYSAPGTKGFWAAADSYK